MKQPALVFKSPASSEAVGEVAHGEEVWPSGPPVVVGQSRMVPVEPDGYIDLLSFEVMSRPTSSRPTSAAKPRPSSAKPQRFSLSTCSSVDGTPRLPESQPPQPKVEDSLPPQPPLEAPPLLLAETALDLQSLRVPEATIPEERSPSATQIDVCTTVAKAEDERDVAKAEHEDDVAKAPIEDAQLEVLRQQARQIVLEADESGELVDALRNMKQAQLSKSEPFRQQAVHFISGATNDALVHLNESRMVSDLENLNQEIRLDEATTGAELEELPSVPASIQVDKEKAALHATYDGKVHLNYGTSSEVLPTRDA